MTPYTLSNGHQGDAQAKINDLAEINERLERQLAELRKNSCELIASLEIKFDIAERDLAEQKAHADAIYKAAVDLAAKLESDLAAERAQLAANHEATKLIGKWLEQERELADRLAGELEGCAELTAAHEALADWKKARDTESAEQ